MKPPVREPFFGKDQTSVVDNPSWLSFFRSLFGVNQTWQDMTSSRALGQAYTNSTGRPIAVKVSVDATGADYITEAEYVNAQMIGTNTVYVNRGGTYYTIADVIVPPGATYAIAASVDAGSIALYSWWELR